MRLLAVLLARGRREEGGHIKKAALDDVVVGHHGTADAREEERVGREVGGKVVAVAKQAPWHVRKPDSRTEQRASSDVDKARTGGGEIVSGGERLAATLTPIWPMMKAKAMKNTPARAPES